MLLAAPVAVPPAAIDAPINWNAGAGKGGNQVPADRTVEVLAFRRSLAFGSSYAFVGGLALAIRGVEVLVERGGPLAAEQVLEGISRQLALLPEVLLERIRQIIVYKGQDVGYDKHWEKAYGIPNFQAVAAGGGGQVTFFGGRPYTDGVLFHELGHNVRVGDWASAQRADDRTIADLAKAGMLRPIEFEHVPDAERRARWTARLTPGGITPYAHGRTGEDISEALRMLLSERNRGHAFAEQVDNATGGVRALPFSVAYPARTRLLELATKFDLDGDGDIGQ